MSADLWDSTGCPICGLPPNVICTTHHLPYAEEDLKAQREKLKRYGQKIEAYRNAVGSWVRRHD